MTYIKNKIVAPLILIELVLSFTAEKTPAQKEESESSLMKFGGYINWTANYDSRQTVSLREGQFLLYPANMKKDIHGNDINAKGNFNILSLQSRLNCKLSGPETFGAKTFGFIEAEFFGTTEGDANGFRLRHAYIGFQWTNSSLLIGQTWHPMFISDAFPQVISFNTGAPFQPFSRNPQIRFTQSLNEVKLVATLYSQRDFTSSGPLGLSSSYLRNAVVPAIDFQLQLKSDPFLMGTGIDFKTLVPRLETNKNIVTDNSVKSLAGFLYVKYASKQFRITSEGVYGQNLADLMMLGGYGVSGIDSVSGSETYTNLSAYSVWVDLSFGSEVELGIFTGYSKNLGSDKPIVDKIYSRVDNMGEIIRISPRATYNLGKIKIGIELELTQAKYGKPDNYGKVNDGEKVTNSRFLIGAFYNL
jgi:hypothetical protein